MYSVYLLKDRSGTVVYVGLSAYPEQRFKNHLSNIRSGRSPISNLVSSADEIEMCIIESHDDKHFALRREAHYILKHGDTIANTMCNDIKNPIKLPRRNVEFIKGFIDIKPIERVRCYIGVSQEVFAGMMGVSKSTYRNWVLRGANKPNGKLVDTAIKKLMKKYKVTRKELTP